MDTMKVAPEFGSWPIDEVATKNIGAVRTEFDQLLLKVQPLIPKGNERYLAIVKTKLEEACLFAVKAITKPVGN